MGTNMIDPKRMERIWKACPELRPEQMEWWKDDACWFANGQPDGITPMIAAALIRDKCVWWLVFAKWARLRPLADGIEIWWDSSNADGFEVLARHADPTEACLLAVERVLGLEPWV